MINWDEKRNFLYDSLNILRIADLFSDFSKLKNKEEFLKLLFEGLDNSSSWANIIKTAGNYGQSLRKLAPIMESFTLNSFDSPEEAQGKQSNFDTLSRNCDNLIDLLSEKELFFDRLKESIRGNVFLSDSEKRKLALLEDNALFLECVVHALQTCTRQDKILSNQYIYSAIILNYNESTRYKLCCLIAKENEIAAMIGGDYLSNQAKMTHNLSTHIDAVDIYLYWPSSPFMLLDIAQVLRIIGKSYGPDFTDDDRKNLEGLIDRLQLKTKDLLSRARAKYTDNYKRFEAILIPFKKCNINQKLLNLAYRIFLCLTTRGLFENDRLITSDFVDSAKAAISGMNILKEIPVVNDSKIIVDYDSSRKEGINKEDILNELKSYFDIYKWSEKISLSSISNQTSNIINRLMRMTPDKHLFFPNQVPPAGSDGETLSPEEILDLEQRIRFMSFLSPQHEYNSIRYEYAKRQLAHYMSDDKGFDLPQSIMDLRRIEKEIPNQVYRRYSRQFRKFLIEKHNQRVSPDNPPIRCESQKTKDDSQPPKDGLNIFLLPVMSDFNSRLQALERGIISDFSLVTGNIQITFIKGETPGVIKVPNQEATEKWVYTITEEILRDLSEKTLKSIFDVSSSDTYHRFVLDENRFVRLVFELWPLPLKL